MKVLLLIHNQQGTGPYPKVLEQAEAMRELGVQVTLLCTSRTSRLRMRYTEERGVRVVLAPDALWGRLRQGVDPWNALQRAGFATRETFDVVHAIDCRPAVIVPALWRKWRARTPLVLSWWDLYGGGGTARERSGALYARTLGVLEGQWELMFRSYADRAVVISTELRRRLEATGYPPEHILLQRIGCDTRAYAPLDKEATRSGLGLPVQGAILCYVGTAAPSDRKLLTQSLALVAGRYRGDLLAIAVGTALSREDVPTDVPLLIVERQPLETVYRYLAAADLCLLPLCESLANRARWPSKAADYFNAGRPVVTTRVSDFEALFAQYSLGYVAERGTPEAYAAAVLAALETPWEWERMGRAGRRFAEERLDTRVLAKELLGVYRGVLA